MDGLQQRINEVATWFLSQQISVIPLGDNKKPSIKWGDYIEKPLEKWDFRGCNIALLTGHFNNLVVADCDSFEAYTGWLNTKPETPLSVRTKRGMQFYYRHPGRYVPSAAHIKDPTGFEYDIKGDRSYVVSPPSVIGGHQYQFQITSHNQAGKYIPFSKLPVFQMDWRPETVTTVCNDKKIKDGVKYIEKIYATAGSGGDKETFRAACKLIESGMSESDALLALMEWNQTNAKPPWGNGQLLYKIKQAVRSLR